MEKICKFCSGRGVRLETLVLGEVRIYALKKVHLKIVKIVKKKLILWNKYFYLFLNFYCFIYVKVNFNEEFYKDFIRIFGSTSHGTMDKNKKKRVFRVWNIKKL